MSVAETALMRLVRAIAARDGGRALRLLAASPGLAAERVEVGATRHDAMRTRCASAVRALLDGGADPQARNGSGSIPTDLATRNTGRGGSGSPQSKAQQEEIIRLLEQRSVSRHART